MMAAEYLFERVTTQFRPVLPREDRKPDGDRYMTADQCAEQFGRTVSELRREWVEFFRSSEDPAIEPDAASRPHAIEQTTRAATDHARLAVLRRVRFPQIVNDDHWRFALDECRRLGVDPADVWIKLEYNDDTENVEPKIITTLLVLRQIAERTGLKAGEAPPRYCSNDGAWCEVWTSDKPPLEARAVVTRRDTDEVFEGIATFRRCASWTRDENGDIVLTKAWRDDPAAQLGKCAIVAAHRVAFGAFIGGLMTKDENDPKSLAKFSRKESAPANQDTKRDADTDVQAVTNFFSPASLPTELPDDIRIAAPLVDDTTPDSEMRLRIELMELGVTPLAKAASVVELFKHKFPRVLRANLRSFCAVALKCVRDNPVFYGAAA